MAGRNLRRSNNLRSRSRSFPEGPYEYEDASLRPGVANSGMLTFLDFYEKFEYEMESSLTLKRGYSETPILSKLVGDHLLGKTTTKSSLIGSSGMSYGTALRAINSMEQKGLIVKRPRTITGKSFSLHPSEKILHEWQEFARRTQIILENTFGKNDKNKSTNYFFGSSYASSKVLPPPSVMSPSLALAGDLRLLQHADPSFMAMETLKRHFERIFGISLKSRALSIDRLREEILLNANRVSSRYDIVACDLPWFGEMGNSGHFLPLSNIIKASSFDTSDFHPKALASARFNGIQYGLPVQTTPELLVYRQDIFSELGLKPPINITNTLIAAKKIHSPFDGMSGIAWNAARGTPLGHSFLYAMAAFGQPALNLNRLENGFDVENIEGENLRPMFDTDAAMEAAEYLNELLDFSPRGILNMSWFDRALTYSKGKSAIAYCATLLAPLFELESTSEAFGKTEYLPLPNGRNGSPIAPIGGYALAIPSNVEPSRVEAIWTALKSLTSPEIIKLYIENGSLVSPRFSVCQDPEVQNVSPLISIVDEMVRADTVQMWPRPPVPEITEIISILGNEIHDALRGHKSLRNALQISQNRVDQMMRSKGYY
ncbi:MAG: extracellular solute-binding protein [SAR202 cluster bacterium]|nr:extracellular solute-binding protein [SAR202 cluster bacterium]